jgi:hypothetical protein
MSLDNLPKGDNIVYRSMSLPDYEEYQKSGKINAGNFNVHERHGNITGFHKPDAAILTGGVGNKLVAFDISGLEKGKDWVGGVGGWKPEHLTGEGATFDSRAIDKLKVAGVADVTQELHDDTLLRNVDSKQGVPTMKGGIPGQKPDVGSTVRQYNSVAQKMDSYTITGDASSDHRHKGSWNAENNRTRSHDRIDPSYVVSEGDIQEARARVSARQSTSTGNNKPPKASLDGWFSKLDERMYGHMESAMTGSGDDVFRTNLRLAQGDIKSEMTDAGHSKADIAKFDKYVNKISEGGTSLQFERWQKGEFDKFEQPVYEPAKATGAYDSKIITSKIDELNKHYAEQSHQQSDADFKKVHALKDDLSNYKADYEGTLNSYLDNQAKEDAVKKRKANESKKTSKLKPEVQKHINEVEKFRNQHISRVHSQIDNFAKENPSFSPHAKEFKKTASNYLNEYYRKDIETSTKTNVFSDKKMGLHEARSGLYEMAVHNDMRGKIGLNPLTPDEFDKLKTSSKHKTERKAAADKIEKARKQREAAQPKTDPVQPIKKKKANQEKAKKKVEAKLLDVDDIFEEKPRPINKLGQATQEAEQLVAKLHPKLNGRGGPPGRSGLLGLAVVAGIGAVGGLAKSGFDKEDDGILSTGAKMIGGAGLAVGIGGATRFATQSYLASNRFGKALTASGLAKQDVAHFTGIAQKAAVRNGFRGGIGAAAGLIYTMANSKDDGVMSTLVNATAGAGLVMGGSKVYDYMKSKGKAHEVTAQTIALSDIEETMDKKTLPGLGSKKKIAPTYIHPKLSNEEKQKIKRNIKLSAEKSPKHLYGKLKDGSEVNIKISTLEENKSFKVSKLQMQDIRKSHEKTMHLQKRKSKIKGWAGKGALAATIGLGAFAIASAMDVNDRMQDKVDESKMTHKQEQKLQRKMSQERKNKAQYAYGHIDMGQMVTDIFNDRSGHHLMGNARFKQPVYNTQYSQ